MYLLFLMCCVLETLYFMFQFAALAFLLSMLVGLNLQAACSLHHFAHESTIGLLSQPGSNSTSTFLSSAESLAPMSLVLVFELFYLNVCGIFFAIFGLDHSDQISLRHQYLWKSPLSPKTCVSKMKELNGGEQHHSFCAVNTRPELCRDVKRMSKEEEEKSHQISYHCFYISILLS